MVSASRLAALPVGAHIRLVTHHGITDSCIERALEVGRAPQHLILGEVLRFHIDESVWVDGEVDVEAADDDDEPFGYDRTQAALAGPADSATAVRNRLLAAGQELDEVCRHLETTASTWHPWVAQYGGMKADEAKRLKELEIENRRLKKAVADLTLDKLILTEAAKGNF